MSPRSCSIGGPPDVGLLPYVQGGPEHAAREWDLACCRAIVFPGAKQRVRELDLLPRARLLVPGESLHARADGGCRRARVELDRVQRPVRLDHGERDVVLEGDGKREVQGALAGDDDRRAVVDAPHEQAKSVGAPFMDAARPQSDRSGGTTTAATPLTPPSSAATSPFLPKTRRASRGCSRARCTPAHTTTRSAHRRMPCSHRNADVLASR